MPGFDRHVFVCINERAPTNSRGCCSRKGGVAVRDRFKKVLADLGLDDRVRANKSGCLDQCERGVTVVVYPEQVWYGGVAVEDVEEIVVSHIVGGQLVDRLLMSEQPHLAGLGRLPVLEPGGR